MGEAYPDLPAQADIVVRALHAEEERFAQTLDSGMKIFDDVAAQVTNGIIPGVDAFRLYDTYGFPLDLTQDIARERDLVVDIDGFDAAMKKQRDDGRKAGKGGAGVVLSAELVATLKPTVFLGYDRLQADGLTVVALLKDGRPVDSAQAGDDVIVLTDQTPFYAESGGQVGDTGTLAGNGVQLQVSDTQKFAGQYHGHVGQIASGGLKVGDVLSGQVDGDRRGATILNHSATHLLHAALREVLGTHVHQKGSLVAPDRLRFDFSHFEPISAADLAVIERKVNEQVRVNNAVEVRNMAMQEALDFGAMALFGEKYGENVRVLKMGDYSTELCGGTHVTRTGDIGLFKITSEGGVSSGVRRIEAVTGQGALDYVAHEEAQLTEAAALLGGSATDVVEKIRQLGERQKKLERELEQLKAKQAAGATSDLGGSAVEVKGVKILAARLEGFDAKALRDAIDRLKQQLGDAVIVLAGTQDGKAALVAGVNGSAMGKVKAGELLSHLASQIGGKGGGRPDLAQGGGEDGPALVSALAAVVDWVTPRI
jgi:alanyl-tRNA synthetase